MKRSPRWAAFKVFRVIQPDGLYLWRLRIIETPWFALWLHAIHKPDEGRDLHDHPRSFVSIVLRGSYVEEVPAYYETVPRFIKWINVKRATDLHRIVSLSRTPTWTLLLCGPRGRKWGFMTEAGWVPFDEYAALGATS